MNRNDDTAYRVSDLDAAIRFYTESLGLRLLRRGISEVVQEASAFLELEGGNLELIQTLNIPFVRPKIEPPYCPHLGLETADMDNILALIKAKRIPVVQELKEIPGNEKWIYISDPDGNVIEYIQWISKSV